MKRALGAVALAGSLIAGCVNVTPLPTSTHSTPAPTTRPPTATPSLAPTATTRPAQSGSPQASGPPASPSGSLDPALATEIDAVIASVPAVRELQPTRDVPFEFISRDQFRDDLVALNDAEVPVEVRAAEERLLKRLGLLPADASLDALVLDLYGAQVLAYYQPDNGRFYIISRDQPFGPSDKIVVAHEYTHALQDQHFDLKTNTISDPSQGDAQLGQLAVIEGDATLTSQLWASQNLTPDELLQLLGEAFGGLDQSQLEGIPLVLRRQLEFPYTEGFLFANGLYEESGFDAVNAAIQTPPASTEQILHPEKYTAHEEPIDLPGDLGLPIADFSQSMGTGWTRTYEQTMGELGIQILATGGEEPAVNLPGLPVDWPHQEVAAGWGGDRLNMYENSDGRWLVLWATAWDSEADQSEFLSRVSELAPTFTGPSSTVYTQDQTNFFLITGVASDDATLSAGLKLFSDIQ